MRDDDDGQADEGNCHCGCQRFRDHCFGIGDRQRSPEQDALVLALGVQRVETVEDRQDRARKQERCGVAHQQREHCRATFGLTRKVLRANDTDVDDLLVTGCKYERGHDRQDHDQPDHGGRDIERPMFPDLALNQCQLMHDHAAAPLTLATNKSTTDGV